ncbi:MAG: hypothetical protein ACREXY_15835 [Gammaproteobacteria bacterium]
MTRIRLQSVAAPFDEPEVSARAARVLTRAEAMGLLTTSRDVEQLDLARFRQLVQQMLRRGGIGRDAVLRLRADGIQDSELLRRLLDQLYEQLEDSPVPEREWETLGHALGDELLAQLLGISGSSLHRYATGQRETPDSIAAKLHYLALIVGDLAGGYNERGIRRWFERRRVLLGGKAPLDLLSSRWEPDSAPAVQVRDLASAFASSPAT